MNVIRSLTFCEDVLFGPNEAHVVVAKLDELLNIHVAKVGDRRELGDEWALSHDSTPK